MTNRRKIRKQKCDIKIKIEDMKQKSGEFQQICMNARFNTRWTNSITEEENGISSKSIYKSGGKKRIRYVDNFT